MTAISYVLVFLLGFMVCGMIFIEPSVKERDAKIHCVYDYSLPVSKRKIASFVTLKKASKLYWKSPDTRKIFTEL